jgi:Mor family transcriptional regulator
MASTDFKDYYEISNLGRLKTKSRLITRGGENNRYSYWKAPRIVSVRRSKENPHLFASLYANEVEKNKTKYIHKLVAEAFLPRPSKDHVYVSHKDENYDNNMLSNLYWKTASESSKASIVKYPENGLKLKEHNIKVGFYKALKLDIWKKKNVKKILKMRNWGVSVNELSRIFECSTASIYNVIRKHNGKK